MKPDFARATNTPQMKLVVVEVVVPVTNLSDFESSLADAVDRLAEIGAAAIVEDTFIMESEDDAYKLLNKRSIR